MSYKHFFQLLRFIFLYDYHSYSFSYFRRENVSKKKKIKECDFESGSLDQGFSTLAIHKLKNVLKPEPHPRPMNQNLGTRA